MVPLLVWLAGVLTAAASDVDQEQRHKKLMDALSARLGSGTFSKSHTMSPGVPVWVWPDGDRIVRIVLSREADTLDTHFDFGMYSVEALSCVRQDEEFPDEVETADFALFAYMNEVNVPQAVLLVHRSGDSVELVALSGDGDENSLMGDKIRSRVFQFMVDHGMDQGLDSELVVTLWHDDIHVQRGVKEVIDRSNAGFPGDETYVMWLGEVSGLYGGYVKDYADIYNYLLDATKSFTDQANEIRKLRYQDPDSYEFMELLQQFGDEWRLEDLAEDQGIDLDVVSSALSGDEESLDILSGSLDLGSLQGSLVEMYEDELSYARERLFQAVESEATAASNVFYLSNHARSHEIQRSHWHSRQQERSAKRDFWNVVIFERREPTVEMEFWISDENVPYWEVGGHRTTDPGFLPKLIAEKWTETDQELYDKVPEETVWVWPGENLTPHLEALFLLDENNLDPTRLPLDKFLCYSQEVGLLLPAVQDYWQALLGRC